MKEVVLITGANGMIAKKLSENLKPFYQIRFLTRHKKQDNEFEWDVAQGTIDEAALSGVQHVIHLAGANIAEKSWSEQRKKEIISSRVDSAQLLLKTLKKNQWTIESFVSASAVGYYGAVTTGKIFSENDAKGDDFLSDVVAQWEQSADLFLQEKVAERVVKLRTGVVLSKNGGALPQMLMPTRFFMGTILGKGQQWMPWIHEKDICAMYAFSIQNKTMNGVFNACSPMHQTYEELTRNLSKALKKSVLMIKIPSFFIRMVFGESAVMLLQGSRVNSERIIDHGFQFQFSQIDLALKDLLKK